MNACKVDDAIVNGGQMQDQRNVVVDTNLNGNLD